MNHDSKCLKIAEKMLQRSYAPYSRFHVAVVLVGTTGKLYTGVNVENASYGLTICAERVAIGTAITQGEREISAVYIVTDTPQPTSPCGACRQVLREFGKDIRVVMGTVSGKTKISSLKKLLPASFGPENLNHRT